MTRDQFEVHVRAEAERKYPLASAIGSMLSSRAIHRLEEFDDKAELRREAYIATRMEHEWPLVEALYGLCYGPMSMEDAADVAMDVLSPYTTKPIER